MWERNVMLRSGSTFGYYSNSLIEEFPEIKPQIWRDEIRSWLWLMNPSNKCRTWKKFQCHWSLCDQVQIRLANQNFYYLHLFCLFFLSSFFSFHNTHSFEQRGLKNRYINITKTQYEVAFYVHPSNGWFCTHMAKNKRRESWIDFIID